MRKPQNIFAAVVITLMLAGSNLAGDMHSDFTGSLMPARAIQSSTTPLPDEEASDIKTEADSHTEVVEDVLIVLQIILTIC